MHGWGVPFAARVTIAALVGMLAILAPTPPPTPPVPRGPFQPWTPHDVLRGMGLPPKTPVTVMDYQALDLIQPGSVVLFSAQLGEPDPTGQMANDPELQQWLVAHQNVTQIVRMWPVKGPDDPEDMARRIVALHARYPWITWFQIANEPDIEWSSPDWRAIESWTEAVWWDVTWYRQHEPGANNIKLLFPPLAQGSRLDPEHVGYDALRPAIELYLDHGDGLAGHEYWDVGDVYLVEDQWPAWLQARLASVPFFVTECGRRPGPQNGLPDAALGRELVSFAQRTRAQVVAPFVLSSANGVFDQYDFVDRDGQMRPALFQWGLLGP